MQKVAPQAYRPNQTCIYTPTGDSPQRPFGRRVRTCTRFLRCGVPVYIYILYIYVRVRPREHTDRLRGGCQCSLSLSFSLAPHRSQPLIAIFPFSRRRSRWQCGGAATDFPPFSYTLFHNALFPPGGVRDGYSIYNLISIIALSHTHGCCCSA